MNTSRLLTVVFITCFTLTNCKKENNGKNNCRLVSTTDVFSSGTVTTSITYDNDGRISTANLSGSLSISRVFTYNGNTIVINATKAGAFYARDSVTLDGRGRPLNLRQYYNEGRTDWSNIVFEYNGDDLLKMQRTTEDASTTANYLAAYSNGNMVGQLYDGQVSTYEYYTDKKVQPADFLQLTMLLQFGVPMYPQKNLLKSMKYNNGTIVNYNYTINDNGQITKLTVTGGSSVSTITCQYECE